MDHTGYEFTNNSMILEMVKSFFDKSNVDSTHSYNHALGK